MIAGGSATRAGWQESKTQPSARNARLPTAAMRSTCLIRSNSGWSMARSFQSTLARLKVSAEGLTEGSGNGGLDAVLGEIDLRVAVELAKAGIC